MTDVCVSGGARGSDVLWGLAAAARGHHVVHYSFAGHKAATGKGLVYLGARELADVDWYLECANKILERKYPPTSLYVHNLLRRNWFQINPAKSLYAVSTFKHGQVTGGTAWAVVMFLLKFAMAPCPAYVFDQELCFWYQWVGEWQKMYEPPPPEDVYA